MMSGFPGGVGLSGLHVYDWPAADGRCGGSPHVHLVCAEAYAVTAGRGRVQTLTRRRYAETALAPGDVAWFTPGTIHRLINDGGLEILVIMENSGLPEAGDAVFTFPAGLLADPRIYANAAALPPRTARIAARRRRDLAITGFLELRSRMAAGEAAALDTFYRSATRLKAPLLDEWEKRWRHGALAAAERTGDQLEKLRAGDLNHLAEATVHHLPAPPGRTPGMCGDLATYDLSDTPGRG